ncbi:MAG: RagB/SusD family nutrient uptake outer membrane protein [Saprospiraceae bacterium]|nr:RagB/SusD family nutrient uptake outer membrane protein [Saprospiraceae bacterium]MCB9326958.1 RagB/SusD family nutrient uptake outer membrane protein [Lewinellaceae bacterium]
MKVFKIIGTFSFFSFVLLMSSCTDLKEEIKDGVVPEAGTVDVQALLDDAYLTLQTFQTQDQIWALQQHSSDETMGPTRGTDWDDNGIWRTLHDHTWDPEHNFNRFAFNSMGRGLYLSNNILAFSPSQEQEMAARFLRAFYMYTFIDNWGQVPTRVPGEDIARTDPTVMTSAEATNYVISELESILTNLPDGVPAYQASKNAARALLAKMYLNKGVWTDDDRIDPSFAAADMNKVIEYCDQIINSGAYQLAVDYWDNFRPDNDQVSTELIFTSRNQGGIQTGNVQSRWHSSMHYNQNPSGWNGFCTIAEFYDKFQDPNDVRLSYTAPELAGISGAKMGFQVGQQYDKDGNPLQDRRNHPLIFTEDVSIFETSDFLEVTGIRPVKYVPDFDNLSLPDNDYVLLRYADVLLMKAEAIARGGSATGGQTAASIVNDIRTKRGTTANSTGSLTEIYDERGFELWWEGFRRQDQIRFGTFLDAWDEKPASEPFRVLFPIPAVELSANPNIKQNPGY